jgi:uncharacterized protein Veg
MSLRNVCILHHYSVSQPTKLRPEDGRSMALRNVGILHHYSVSQYIELHSEYGSKKALRNFSILLPTWCHNPENFVLKMEATRPSETLVSYTITPCHNPENFNLNM